MPGILEELPKVEEYVKLEMSHLKKKCKMN